MEHPYRPARTIVSWAVGLLFANIGLAVLFALFELIIGIQYPDFYDYNATATATETALSVAFVVVGLLGIAVYIPTVVMFCVWMFRASKNARALGAREMRISAGWGVGSFFVPILNLFRPYQAVKEIEKASSPDAGPMDWAGRDASGLVGAWWTFWLIGGVFDQISSSMGNSTDPAIAHSSSWFGVIGSLLTIAAGIYAIRVIRHIDQLQETKVRVQPMAQQSTCLACGYDLRGTPGLYCPECGAAIPGRDTDATQLVAPDPAEPWTHA